VFEKEHDEELGYYQCENAKQARRITELEQELD
jgi:hypothetical protein